jgi:hypothetical protein
MTITPRTFDNSIVLVEECEEEERRERCVTNL